MLAPHYLDHHSTTPCLPEVVEAMLPYFTELYGNPSALTHAHGREAGKAVERARVDLATALSVDPSEIYFTAGATESNNIALNGEIYSAGDHILASPIEHKSILAPLELLRQRAGVDVEFLTVDGEGFVDPEEVSSRLRHRTRLVTIMAANGEIGTVEPTEAIAAICRERGVRFHTDATQAVGKIAVAGIAGTATSFAFSAHKFYGPKGIGALVVRRGTRMEKGVAGGGQERGLRSGTVNVPAVVGMAAALRIASADLGIEAARLIQLRDRLRAELVDRVEGTFVHGPTGLRLPGNLNVSFAGLDGEALMLSMRHFSLSSGAACSSGDREPSHVLKAIGVERGLAAASIRIGLGRSTTSEMLELLVRDFKENVTRLREINA